MPYIIVADAVTSRATRFVQHLSSEDAAVTSSVVRESDAGVHDDVLVTGATQHAVAVGLLAGADACHYVRRVITTTAGASCDGKTKQSAVRYEA